MILCSGDMKAGNKLVDNWWLTLYEKFIRGCKICGFLVAFVSKHATISIYVVIKN